MSARIILSLLLFVSVPAAAEMPSVFLPVPPDGTYGFLHNNRPLLSMTAESTYAVISVDRVSYQPDEYVRVWLLFYNGQRSTITFDPNRFARIEFQEPKFGMRETMGATDAEVIWRKVLNSDAIASINQTYGSRGPDSLPPASNPGWKISLPEDSSSAVSIWRDILPRSIPAGVLRPIDLTSGDAVTGFIYLPLPSNEIIRKNLNEMENGRYLLHLLVPGRKLDIELKEFRGE